MTEFKEVINVHTITDNFTLVGRPCELSAYSFIPPNRNLPKERTYFNSDQKDRYSSNTYDRLFHQDYGYNEKLHRCDREHAKSRGLTVNNEEFTKSVPALASSIYGHKLDDSLDPRDRKHVRIAHVKTEFYRRTGINVNADEGVQPLND